MSFLTNEKLVIVGAGGMIGSNMAQSVLTLGLTPNVCLYDIFEPGLHGVANEIAQCGFPGANITWTTNPEEAFTGAKYIISSGGAPRKEGMTREDLLKGNCKIAAEFGENIKKYCPEVKFVVVIFNPADVTALTALIHSGLKPNQLTSLAALGLYPSPAGIGIRVRRTARQGNRCSHLRWSRRADGCICIKGKDRWQTAFGNESGSRSLGRNQA